MVWIALISMVVGVLIQHLGLSEAAVGVVQRIAKCPKCCAFWLTLATLAYFGYDPLASLALSILMAYMSSFFGLALVLLNRLYLWLWEKTEK